MIHSPPSSQRGFTLIELLAVIAIIGLLASIAVSSFSESRRNAFDKRAMTDLRHAATASEAYFADQQSYKSCASAGACQVALPGIAAFSSGVTLQITATATGFTGTASHPNGTGAIYTWNSALGGMQ